MTAALACATLSACQWRLPEPTLADSATDVSALDSVTDTITDTVDDRVDAIASDIPIADASTDGSPADVAADSADARARRVTFPACGSPSTLLPDTVPSAPLYHAISLNRPVSGFANGRGVCVGDLDGDGALELVALRPDDRADVLDPATLCVRATIRVPDFARGCVIDDFDADGEPDLALALNERFGVRTESPRTAVAIGHIDPPTAAGAPFGFRSPTAWQITESRNIRGIGVSIASLDLDRDGERELVVAGSVTQTPTYADAFVRAWEFSPTGACLGESRCPRQVVDHTFDSLDAQTLLVASTDSNPDDELHVELGCNRGGIFRFDNVWAPPTEVGVIGQTSNGAFADLDGDGALDLLTATSPRCNGGAGGDSSIRWLRPEGGRFRYYTEVANPAIRRAAQAFVAPIDTIGDARPEALLCTRDADNTRALTVRCDLFYIDTPFFDPEWTWTEPGAGQADILSRVIVFDANRDGRNDALVVSEARLHLLLNRRR